jgi:hypothetical protein
MKFGGIEMPVYQGYDEDGRHVTKALFQVEGRLDDGREFSLMISAGFIFDGASIPRVLWRVCGHPLSVPRVAAALAHDWLYRAHVCDRKLADEIYRTICRQVGIGGFCAGTEHYTLRMFGKGAWKSWKAYDQIEAREYGLFILNGEVVKGT